MNKELNPDDFWPDAEKLLDKHYKIKRQRKAALWIISACILIGFTVYVTFNRNHKVELSNASINQTSNQTSATATKTIDHSIKTDNNINTTEPGTKISNNSTESTIKDTNSKLKSTSQINSINNINSSTNKYIGKTNTINNGENKIKLNESQVTNSDKTTKRKIENKDVVAINVHDTKSKSDNSKTIITQGNQKTLSEISSENNNSETKLQHQTIKNKLDNNSLELFTMLNGPLTTPLNQNFNSRSNLFSQREDPKIPNASKSVEYRINVTAGANLITKKLTGIENSSVAEKRNSGESNLITPQLNFEISRVTDKTAYSIGINYQQYGEKVNYDPTGKRRIIIDNGHWNTFLTTIVDTDTNYVYGFVYYSQQTIQRYDSTYIQQHDSVDQVYANSNLINSNSTNRISFIEIPITAGYYFGQKKFRCGIVGGVSAGILVYSAGFYLNNNGDNLIRFREEKVFRTVIVNGLLGFDFQYYLSPSLHLLLRPQYRTNLNSILTDKVNGNQKYSAYGISAGISFLLK